MQNLQPRACEVTAKSKTPSEIESGNPSVRPHREVYWYLARTEEGHRETGTVEASSPWDALGKPALAGRHVIRLRPWSPKNPSIFDGTIEAHLGGWLFAALLLLSRLWGAITGGGGVSALLHYVRRPRGKAFLRERLYFVKTLATFVSGSIPLDGALRHYLETCSGHSLWILALEDILRRLGQGASLSAALRQPPSIPGQPLYWCMPSYAIGILQAGEALGTYGPSLHQIADIMEAEMGGQQDFWQRCGYPLATLFMSLILLGCLVVFGVPWILTFLGNSGAEVPPLLQWLATVQGYGYHGKVPSDGGHALARGLLMVLPLVVLGGGLGYVLLRYGRLSVIQDGLKEGCHTSPGEVQDHGVLRPWPLWDTLMMAIPWVGSHTMKKSLWLFSTIFARLSTAGIPTLSALSIAVGAMNNKWMERYGQGCVSMLGITGGCFGDILMGSWFDGQQGFSRSQGRALALVARAWRHGKASGQMDGAMTMVAQTLSMDLARDNARVIRWVKFGSLGVSVFIIVCILGGVYLPLYESMGSAYV